MVQGGGGLCVEGIEQMVVGGCGWRCEVDRRGKRPPSLGRATTVTALAVAMDVPTGAVRRLRVKCNWHCKKSVTHRAEGRQRHRGWQAWHLAAELPKLAHRRTPLQPDLSQTLGNACEQNRLSFNPHGAEFCLCQLQKPSGGPTVDQNPTQAHGPT